ncbi:methyltransferase [Legionella dresdenensis]|uniref:Histone-lysine N-methyltransferase, H3 lysine-79 specific n=1 Tax=Legionella dresdenensis TaxID=450200 RepID=A0ABV8CHV5_9GAMM
MVLLYLCFSLAALYLLIRWQRAHPYHQWRKRLQLARHESVFNQLYETVNGFELSKQARQSQDAPEYVYGEIEFESFIALIALCKPDADCIFYDLGSGAGKAVLACAMVFPVKKSYGVELFGNLHQCANRQKQTLSTLTGYSHCQDQITFIQSDLLHIPLTDATLIFINATSFFGYLWQQISIHLEQIPNDAIVISTSKKLASDKFSVDLITRVNMSWGPVHAYIQRRLPDNGSIELPEKF